MEILFLIALIVLNGAFAMSELALASSRKSKLAAMAQAGDKSAQAALALLENPTQFLSSVQVGITSIGVLNGIIGETNLMQYAMTVAASADVDEETVYKVVKAIHENKEALVAAHPSFNAMSPDSISVLQPDVKYHPGAIRYYKEIGIWKGE